MQDPEIQNILTDPVMRQVMKEEILLVKSKKRYCFLRLEGLMFSLAGD